jgi:hypothetical protein
VGCYLSEASGANKLTGIAIEFSPETNEIVLQGVEDVRTGVSIRDGGGASHTPVGIYRMTLKFDWTEMTMEGLLQDVTDGGEAVGLGKVDISLNSEVDKHEYGLFIRSAGQIICLDDIEIVQVSDVTER